MVRITSGGGYNSRVVSHANAPKQEPKAKAVSPSAVDQMGQATTFKKQELFQGQTLKQGPMPAAGIANTSKGPAGAGPGGYGRTIYAKGSQSPTPPAREMPAGRDILSEYGRDIPGRGRR